MAYDIDLAGVSSREELHERLRQALPLPSWYGNNLDALRDALGDLPAPVEVIFRNASAAAPDMQDYIRRLRRLGVDLMLAFPRGITVRWLGAGKSPYRLRAEALRNDPAVHYNCAQGVLMAFAPAAGLEDDTAFRLAANFGGGMRRASVCGAVTGGLMVLGLFGLDDAKVVGEYHRRLKEAHEGYLDCADLLRLNAAQGREKKPHCDDMVYECVALTEELLRKYGKI